MPQQTYPNFRSMNKSGNGTEKNITGLPALLRNIEELNRDPALDDMIKRCRQIVEGEEKYVEESCTPLTPLQAHIVRETHEDSSVSQYSYMLSGEVGGCFLKNIAEIARAKRILEIGMFTGFSAVTFSETSNCEEMVCLDIDPDMEKFVRSRIQGTSVDSKIRIIVGAAQESLVKLKDEGKKFDLVYIDANKNGYLDYYKYIMDNGLLERTTGVILCDNILWSNTTMDQSTPGGKDLHEFVQFVLQDGRVEQMIIPISDGIFMIKSKVNN
ncbi:unnamed protein product [Orchesella dallaii]|uniref:Caffeoyl-CoA O-methyltransferase n=1 Tax=Orchesella dallaii TaxID=48710 RepID=A0ABP1QFU0_9HEXA